MSILKVEDLRKSFGGLRAVNGVSLEVREGEIRAIIGPNGAGKTTFFNLITGRLAPDGGRILFKGEDIGHLPPHKILRRGIGRSFQRTNIFPRLTVFENVQVAVLAHQRKAANPVVNAGRLDTVNDEVWRLLKSIDLASVARSPAMALSHGDQKRLEIGVTLATRPELLLLDEPTAGMSVQETGSTVHFIERLSREMGMTLVFTEHDMDVVFGIAERITVLHQGEVIAEGTPGEIRGNPEVVKAYLGEE